MAIDLGGASKHNNQELDRRNAAGFEDILTYLALCERPDNSPILRAQLDGAILFGNTLASASFGKTERDVTRLVRNARKAVKSWHGKFVDPVPARDWTPEERPVCDLLTIRQITDPVVVKLASMYEHTSFNLLDLPMVGVNIDTIDESGHLHERRACHFWVRGSDVLVPNSHPEAVAAGGAFMLSEAALAMNMAETRWMAYVRMQPGCPAVGFFTDPTGIRELLKFREVGMTGRRDAIVHWVSQHWRQDRYDPEMELYVREHLRGASVLQWHGMTVEVDIPPADLMRVEAGKEFRRRLSAAQLTKRLREHRRRK